jgi:hypothetical protein
VTRWVYVLSVLVLLLVPVAAAATRSVPVGTWTGRIVPHERTYTIPAITLEVTPNAVRERVSGLTGAAHDAPTATTTCSVSYRYEGEKDGWFYYQQSAPSRLTAAGYVEGAPCSADGRRSPGGEGYLLRLHPSQGGKLAVEVTTWGPAPHSLPDIVEALKRVGWRGYLTH